MVTVSAAAKGSESKDGKGEPPGVSDMTLMSDITEHSINDNLRRRYEYDRIYTYAGSILVAVNPYKELECYNVNAEKMYRGHKLGALDPHIFALADAAYSSLQNDMKNQSVVISGESGAGKTETTKFILQYLCSATVHGASHITSHTLDNSIASAWVEQQILEANTVLEAFGNAKTVRNDNSSRFGKFMQVCLDARGAIAGAVVQDYLLEQSRITFQAPQERNYHVFYYLAEGVKSDPELQATLHLKEASHFVYLKQSGCLGGPGAPPGTGCGGESEKLEALRLAFTVLQVPPHMSEGLFKVLAAILWLGNIEFEDVDGERCALVGGEEGEALKAVAELLGLSTQRTAQVLLQRQINVRGNITEIPLRQQEARENRHAMAKALYSRVFAWLVSHINRCTRPPPPVNIKSRFLGVLDIFGFENFTSNSFEQLCINYTNEKLHKFFNHYVFALEQEIYRQEGIVFSHIQFTDNTVCLELIERPPRSLLKLLSEQCHMPKGSDAAYLTNIHSEFAEHNSFEKGEDRRKWESEFGVKHYAGTVMYSVAGFVDKNRDTQQDVFLDHLSRSENTFVQELTVYQENGYSVAGSPRPPSTGNGGATPPPPPPLNNAPSPAPTSQRGTSKGRPTVCDTFRQQLQQLVDVLQATNPWYVRCIKPNQDKAPGKYDSELVLTQLRYLGMLDIVRIRREGFPAHLTATVALQKYRCLLSPSSRARLKNLHVNEGVKLIMSEMGIDNMQWQPGHTKIFLRSGAHATLEEKRSYLWSKKAVKIQSWWRMITQRRWYLQRRKAALCLQTALRGWRARAAFLRLRRAALVLQRHLRGAFGREVAAALREMRRVDEEMKRREAEAKAAAEAAAEAEARAAEGKPKDDPEEMRIKTDEPVPRIGASVDLDNLFAFLADVSGQGKLNMTNNDPSANPTIQEIGDHLDQLVGDLDEELENVLKDELRSLALQRAGLPPAPQEPPPPPPPTSLNIPDPIVVNGCGPPPAKKKEEPIYEAVIPRTEPPLPPLPSPPPPPLPLLSPSPPPPPPPVTPPPAAAVAPVPAPPPAAPVPPQPVAQTIKPPPPAQVSNHIISSHNHNSVVQLPITNHVANQQPIEPVSQPPCPSPPPPPIQYQNTVNVEKQAATQQHTVQEQHVQPPLEHHQSMMNGHVDPSSVSSPDLQRSASGVVTCGERTTRRRIRVEKRLQERNEPTPTTQQDELHHDILEFAEAHFNQHPRSPEGTIMATLTRKTRSKSLEMIPKTEMIIYYKGSSIPTSHIHMEDPDNVTIACNIFRELCKYMRGEMNADRETQVIQSIIKHGIEREELRDEIIVQCMRQVSHCPSPEWAERVWLVLCLAAVAWQPSRSLHKYYVSFLRDQLNKGLLNQQQPLTDGGSPRRTQLAQWCLDNCRPAAAQPRKHPPSTVEIAAMRRLGTIVCRFFFLDGRTKAIDVHPTDTAAAAGARLADKLGLRQRDGWAVYQSRGATEEHVKGHHFLYDVIASWEMNQSSAIATQGGFPTVARSSGNGSSSAENRFVFKRRLFRGPRSLSQDPVEVALLYAQAVHSVVKCDEFPVSEKVALQLAGLQAQVSLGEPSAPQNAAYYEPHLYLPPRVAKLRPHQHWVSVIAAAHRQYGAGRSELTAKVLYLTCVMQYPLYGTTLFPVVYRTHWQHGPHVLLGVNCDGIVLVRPEDKQVMAEHRYQDIESLMVDPSDCFLTIMLNQAAMHNNQRCLVVETEQKVEIAELMVSYRPSLSSWLREEEGAALAGPGKAGTPAAERTRLHAALSAARRLAVDSGLLKRPHDPSANFLRNTLRRLSKHKVEKSKSDSSSIKSEDFIESQIPGENYKGFPPGWWAFTKSPITHSLTRLPEADEPAAIQMFGSILAWAGLTPIQTPNENKGNQEGQNSGGAEEHVAIAQSLLEKCLRNEGLLAELYMQLIKQTTDQPEVSSRLALRMWALICVCSAVALPSARPLRRLLLAHLRARAADPHTHQAKYARFAEKAVLRTAAVRRRQWPPSRAEVLCSAARRPLHVRVHLPDGHFHSLQFHPAATSRDLVAMLADKIGLSPTATGFALYEVCGGGERSVRSGERVADVLARWERTPRRAPQLLLLRKHLFLPPPLASPPCSAELHLLLHQLLHQLRADRLPVSHNEAVMMVALQAQISGGDAAEDVEESTGQSPPWEAQYAGVAERMLPPRLAAGLSAAAVRQHHLALRGTPPHHASQSLLNLLQSWPLHAATIFDVMQSFTSNWPRSLWLAVGARGLQLLRPRARLPLCCYEYDSLLSHSPAPDCLLLVTAAGSKHSKVILTTQQGFQISTLIQEYVEALSPPVAAPPPGRPLSSLQPPPPPHAHAHPIPA